MMGAIAGVLSSRSNTAPEYTYFTSALYPYFYEESLRVGNLTPQTGQLWGIDPEEMNVGLNAVTGNLQSVISFITYNDGLPEELDVGLNAVSGNLQTTIAFITYNDGLPEELNTVLVAIVGNLQVTINYIEYQNYTPEELDVGLIAISGSLV